MKVIFLGVALLVALGSSSASLIPPPPGDVCNGPVAGAGLGEAMRELIDLLPLERLLEVFMTWVTNDEGVMDAMEYIGSAEFINIVNIMHNTQEFVDVVHFLCDQCYFDAFYYLNSLGGLFNFPPMQHRPYSMRSKRLSYNGYTGFRGMLRELLDTVPRDVLRATYDHRLNTDVYFQQALAKISSNEFRQVGCAIQATSEYDNLISKLEGYGVDTDEILNALFGFFNWPVNC